MLVVAVRGRTQTKFNLWSCFSPPASLLSCFSPASLLSCFSLASLLSCFCSPKLQSELELLVSVARARVETLALLNFLPRQDTFLFVIISPQGARLPIGLFIWSILVCCKLLWQILACCKLLWQTCFLSFQAIACLPRSSLGSGSKLLKNKVPQHWEISQEKCHKMYKIWNIRQISQSQHPCWKTTEICHCYFVLSLSLFFFYCQFSFSI